MDSGQIQHRFVKVGGLNLHVTDIGTGQNVVVFLHGFPEMIALADYRGYGLSDPPREPEKATFSDLFTDLLGILDAFGLTKYLYCLDAKTVVQNVYILFSRSEIPIAQENQEIMDQVDSSTTLPPWITEQDIAIYGALYEKSGFRTALQVPYRTLSKDLKITDAVIKVPALLIMGGKDYVLKFPRIEELIKS